MKINYFMLLFADHIMADCNLLDYCMFLMKV